MSARSPTALDKMLQGIAKEYETQIDALTAVRGKVEKIIADGIARTERLQERLASLLEAARDDEGDVINPDIEEAIDYLENDGIRSLEDATGITDSIDEEVSGIQGRLDDLTSIIEATPAEGFFDNRPDEDEEDGGDDDDDDDDDDPPPEPA